MRAPTVHSGPERPGALDPWSSYREALASAHADALLGLLETLGAPELKQRSEQARQLARDHGVTYNNPGARAQAEQAWRMDALPVLVAPAEFEMLRKGIAERAHLLDRVLADLYGPQNLLRQGFIPPRLILGNPGFLRPCHGLPTAHRLILYAADVVRTKSGSLCVLRDRTQAPTGAGYALENRLILARVFADAFRKHNTIRLASFFATLREELSALAPSPREQPRVVLQSSGRLSPTYFEQAFLAQYLGYPLVEGGDLTVREGRVLLKTLGGLSPVDVVLRQTEDDYCDPLELRPESQLGVPGLVQAVRSRQMTIANGLGAGLAQAPALLPYLRRIARDFFGETLSLEEAPATWCGDAEALPRVLANIEAMVFRPVWQGAGPAIVFGDRLSTMDRETFLATLRAQPELFVAQERIDTAKEPVLVDDAISPRRWLLRSYAVRSGDGYEVMPGGLALAGATTTEVDVSIVRGALAKDVWVASDESVRQFSLMPAANHSVELSRGGADLPSRSADNLFWLGRYAERAESTARLARYLVARLEDEGDTRTAALSTLMAVLSESTELPLPPDPHTSPLDWMIRCLCSTETSGTLRNTLWTAVRAAGAVRDRLSADTFRVLGSLSDEADSAEQLMRAPGTSELGSFLDRVVIDLCALSGLAMESMTRAHGWRFLDMGRRLERALQLLALLRAALAAGAENESTLFEAVLFVADSSITYRRRYLAGLHPAAVVDLLLVDAGNPRAVLFQLEALRDHLAHLPHEEAQARLRPEERLALACLTRLQLVDVVPACASAEPGKAPPILGLLADVAGALSVLSDELCGSYLSHAIVARALAVTPGKDGA